MKLEARSSEVQFGRHTTTTNPTPTYRDQKSRILVRDEISQPIRREHTTDSISCVQYGNGTEVEVADHEYNESNLPFPQCTSSTTSVELRPTTATIKNDTDVVITQRSASRTSSASPTSSSTTQSSKPKSSFSFLPTPTSSLSLSIATPKGPRKKKIKKGGSGPVPKPPPTIFNVGQSSVLTGLITLSTSTTATATRSTFSLLDDHIPSWDMNIFPSIPSPPDSPMHKNSTDKTASPNASLSYPASFDAPFSTPYDEDALLENEIPFPLNKHSNVIIENMGIKKAKKNLWKERQSLLNRHITTVRPDLHPHSGPTSPLPLRSLCQNTTAQANVPFQHIFSRPTTPGIPTGPSSSKTDAWGCMHLGAADCELSIAFPHTSHYEVWDMGDDAFFACPVLLCLMAKDPRKWAGTPISLPDVSLIDIRCDDLPVPSPMSVYDPYVEYGIQCTVPQKIAWGTELPDFPSSHTQKPRSPIVVDHKEITIDGKWERTYTKPKLQGHGPTRILRLADAMNNAETNEMNGRGWYLKIWIPVPSHLFMKRESRIFEIRASVWMMGDEERGLSGMDSEGEEEYFPLLADAEMTVSHLRCEREMMMTMS